MIVLHGTFHAGRLWLWGEGAAAEETAAAVSGILSAADFHPLPVWLPAVKGRAVPSSPLVGEAPAGKSVLARFEVAAHPLTEGEAIELLAAAAGKHVLKPGVGVAADLAWWALALRFTLALAAREQFLPGLDCEARPAWKPVLMGADVERFEKLAAAMPGVARAAGEAQPGVAAKAVLHGFMEAITDHVVRSASPAAAPGGHESAHDRWLAGLVSRHTPPSLPELVEPMQEWQRPVAVAAEAPFRLCLRLEEPPADSDEWRVQYFLQAARDPSLLVPAEKVWRARRNRALNLPGFDARQHLLFSLGQASGIDPSIDESLKTPAPAGYPLDSNGAHGFLRERSAALEQAGFGVLLPAWWTRRGTKLRLGARASVKVGFAGGGGLGLNDVVKFDWQIALGGEPITWQELQALAKLKSALVQVRGQWVEVTAEEIRAALEFWRNRTGEATVRDVIRMALGAVDAAGALPFEGVEAEGWIGELMEQLKGGVKFEELAPPPGLHATLRPYQVRGYSWLAFLRRWGLGACLADDMGLGKTIQTLSLVERERRANGKRPVLLVCPTSVVGNWQKEAARFTPELPVMVHHGATRAKGERFRAKALQHAMVVSSYALLHRDREVLKQVPWAGVVLDEAQNIKNPETRQAAAAREMPGDYRIALTGTPVENNVGDLWSIMEFLNPGFLGSRAEFKRKFFLPIQAGGSKAAAERLRQLTGPFILRRLKTDKDIIRDLPEKMEIKTFCNLTREQASLYQAVVRDAQRKIEEAEGISRKGLVLATLSKLKQVCNHPAQFLGDNSAVPGRSGKLARLSEMVEELLEEGDRALIFTQFAEMGAILQRHLQESFGRETLFLHGGVPKKKRDEMVARFQAAGGPPLFVLSLKAGGTGLNLTAANHVFHFDRWWNPAVENQATDRAFRIGQTRNVQVYKFLCAGTLEEKIDEMIERKQEVAAGVIGSGEAWLTRLSNAELRELFALRKEAVAE